MIVLIYARKICKKGFALVLWRAFRLIGNIMRAFAYMALCRRNKERLLKNEYIDDRR